jgi:hypothetical protein
MILSYSGQVLSEIFAKTLGKRRERGSNKLTL